MGVIYKLKSEIKDFILEQKRVNSTLSCRGLIALIESKFQVKVSKSSINSIIKQAGLSLPIGRRPKKKRRRLETQIKPIIEIKSEAPVEIQPQEPAKAIIKEPVVIPAEAGVEIQIEAPSPTQGTGAILLKAADFIIKGSYYITEAIKSQLNRQEDDLLAKTESIIYKPLFRLSPEKESQDLVELWALVEKRLSLEDISLYLNELQGFKALPLNIFRIISSVFQEVRCVKVSLSDSTVFYLDGQLYTVWSTPHLPYDFSTTLYNIKIYTNKYFQEDAPFILFMAPGYDMPTKEFFDFILSLDSREKKINSLTLYGHRFEELEMIRLDQNKPHFFIFGLWSWQFGQYREVKIKGEFKSFSCEALKRDVYLAEAEVELFQPNVNKRITLKGCALKTNLNEKIRLVILTNLPSSENRLEELARLYLNRWPNLEECFQDFSRKIELFTYTATSQRFFSTESLNFNSEANQDISALFNYYLKALKLYVRWHFLPLGYEDENSDSPTINERFYSLKTRIEREKERTLVTFEPPSGYPFLKDLEYACRRMNDREILDYSGKRLWFNPCL